MAAGWRRLLDPAFWAWLYAQEVDFEDATAFRLEVRLGEHGLTVEVDEGASVTLVDLETGTELGWLDEAHFHPSCLRVEEVLRLSAGQPAEAERALSVLLLQCFAVATTDDEAAALGVAVRKAWITLGFEGAGPGLVGADFRGQRVAWVRDQEGRWSLRQPQDDLALRPLYTLRQAENPDFPAWLSAITQDP